MKTLKRCINGCDAPPHSPSKVLCEKCFINLDEKMKKLSELFTFVVCERCNGTGEENDEKLEHPRLCIICGGSGTLCVGSRNRNYDIE